MIDLSDQIEKTLQEFETLTKVAIDASSLVYLDRIGLCEQMSEALSLVTVHGVREEEAPLPQKIEVRACTEDETSTDDALVACAASEQIPVVSEDKQVLLAARSKGLPFFNTLMMVNFLFFRNLLTHEELKKKIFELTKFAWYHADVFEYGDLVARMIITKRKAS